jgi:hypothetical protein
MRWRQQETEPKESKLSLRSAPLGVSVSYAIVRRNASEPVSRAEMWRCVNVGSCGSSGRVALETHVLTCAAVSCMIWRFCGIMQMT